MQASGNPGCDSRRQGGVGGWGGERLQALAETRVGVLELASRGVIGGADSTRETGSGGEAHRSGLGVKVLARRQGDAGRAKPCSVAGLHHRSSHSRTGAG
jgi:hypothetical protein